mmetsp:Transcript_31965/g.95457  ORF Transcript_31965/g.95457 Transcript_31965/m.95457 type:complete len:320 (-) Transcript_31965:793-1752(-)
MTAGTSGGTFDPGHADAINDAQLDHHGRHLATCSSDGTVKVFDVSSGEQHAHVADLVGHQGPVWQVGWAHPKWGTLLASAGHDGNVIVWREASDNLWQQVYITPPGLHSSSVNSVAWAPPEVGLALAAGSSDGTVSVLEYAPADTTWNVTKLPGMHAVGVTSVTWAPAVPPGALLSSTAPGQPVKALASAGCDNMVRTWRCGVCGQWSEGEVLQGHTDWVREVAWAPNPGLPKSTIASGAQDGQVFVWSERAAVAAVRGTADATHSAGWDRRLVHDFSPSAVWRVSWSSAGNILTVTVGAHGVSMWREATDGVWQQVVQ